LVGHKRYEKRHEHNKEILTRTGGASKLRKHLLLTCATSSAGKPPVIKSLEVTRYTNITEVKNTVILTCTGGASKLRKHLLLTSATSSAAKPLVTE
jgi:hypothetical protein